jgi:hypothetical protein
MATKDEPSAAAQSDGAGARRTDRDEAARARAYLDLWERHLTKSAVDGPIETRLRPPE